MTLALMPLPMGPHYVTYCVKLKQNFKEKRNKSIIKKAIAGETVIMSTYVMLLHILLPVPQLVADTNSNTGTG